MTGSDPIGVYWENTEKLNEEQSKGTQFLMYNKEHNLLRINYTNYPVIINMNYITHIKYAPSFTGGTPVICFYDNQGNVVAQHERNDIEKIWELLTEK